MSLLAKCKQFRLLGKKLIHMTRNVIIVFLLSGILASCSTTKKQSISGVNQSKVVTMNNKEIVSIFLGAVAKQDAETIRRFANVDYIQHNPFVPTGLEPFIGLLPVLKEYGTHAENVRMFQDRNYVFLHNTGITPNLLAPMKWWHLIFFVWMKTEK